MASFSLGASIDFGASGAIVSVVWHVALLGSPGPLWQMDQADVVCRFAFRVLVGELPVLLFRVSAGDLSQNKG